MIRSIKVFLEKPRCFCISFLPDINLSFDAASQLNYEISKYAGIMNINDRSYSISAGKYLQCFKISNTFKSPTFKLSYLIPFESSKGNIIEEMALKEKSTKPYTVNDRL